MVAFDLRSFKSLWIGVCMTKDEALKQAREALLAAPTAYRAPQTIAAIEKALMSVPDGAQPEQLISDQINYGMSVTQGGKRIDPMSIYKEPEQEPVATDWERIARVQDAKLRAMCNEAGGFEKLCEVMDKYERTTPPPVAEPHKRPSRSDIKPLTDEEIETLWPLRPTDEIVAFARAIEAVHGIIAPTELKEEV